VATLGVCCAIMSNEKIDLVRRHFEHMWNERDFAACDDLITEDYIEHGVAPFVATAPARVHGPTAMRGTRSGCSTNFQT
jgi:hypothetical protein